MKLKATKLLENIKEVFEAVGRFIVGVLLCEYGRMHKAKKRAKELHEDINEASNDVWYLIIFNLLKL